MPIMLDWTDEEQTIQLMQVVKPWTWNELTKATSRSAEMANAITHDYYFIVDFSEAGKLPTGAFTNMARLNDTKPADKDTLLICVIGVSGLLRYSADMFARVFGRNVKTFDSQAEALAEIKKRQKAAKKVDPHA